MRPLVAPLATDFTDSDCDRNTDLDIVPGSSLGLDATMALVTAQAIQIGMALTAVWYSDTNMVPRGSSDPGIGQHCL